MRADGGSEGVKLPLTSKDCERSWVETVSKIDMDGNKINMRNACISSLIAFLIAMSFWLSVAKVAICSSIDKVLAYFHCIMLLSVKNVFSPGLVPWCQRVDAVESAEDEGVVAEVDKAVATADYWIVEGALAGVIN
ncbi:uncharacterized protein BJ212DRAFT_1295944 [Suillus subaureus]|uniref:Uncharacterized protein n=1 Tax=Suillus subaureus TaxID=48587 RepID=A0A9P7ELM1_9AGAM|nr:uncharacterized protein BJ212DRAFT_1295944 [Suillus subaureus]KAG1824884.1 hypothetical protein BJ212DRAFT_1295944 [Suillus subaureus]